jgi:hypothetical protein
MQSCSTGCAERRILPVLLVLLAGLLTSAHAQYIAIGGGGLFPEDKSEAVSAITGEDTTAEFGRSGLLAVDAGVGLLPFLGANLHYSYSSPEMIVRRADLVGSSARADLGSHTLTFDGRVRTPEALGFRLYGLAGGGFTRFTVNIKQTVETPFPEGVPDNVISPVFTFGGGIEKSVFPLLRLKLEARDYVTAISKDFFSPGGRWHRVAVYGGIVLGR